jgi:integrase
MKAELKDRALKALKPEKKPYDVMDAQRAFGVRVMPSGEKTFILYRRFPGSPSPVRRSLGQYGELTLSEAREKAREWLALIKKGMDPTREAKRLQEAAIEAERAKQANTFGSAFESYLKRKASKLRSGRPIEMEMRREFRDWMDRPLADISDRDVKGAIQKIIDRGSPTNAHFVFAVTRGFFNWCIDTGDFGLEISPCAKIKPTVLIGERIPRKRMLKDHEIAAYWRASGAMGYPFGPLFKLLLLTALRRGEAADAEWSEIDIDARLWTVPEGRMKAKESKAVPHAVPLTDDTIALLKTLPRLKDGDFVFSTTGGDRPVSGFSKAKTRLDALMKADLEAQGKQFSSFVIHDIRRTCRSRFSALADVQDVVCEALLAHVQPGIRATYNLYEYLPEKREALQKWHAKLKAIVEPTPDNNVISMRAAASA